MTTTLEGSAGAADTTTPRPWAEVETAIMARALTARSSEHLERLPVRSDADAATKIATARAMLARLERRAELLAASCGDRPGPQLPRLLRAVDEDDHDGMAALGLDIGYAWLDDILTALVSGAPFVEIETVGPYAAHHLDGDGTLDVSADNLPEDERAGLLLAAILRDALGDAENARVVALLDDLNDHVNGRTLDATTRDRYVVQMGRLMYEHGVLRHDDVPGRDYVLLRESAAQHRVDDLTTRLSTSGRGTVQHHGDGDVTFWPSPGFIQQLALASSSRVREFSRRGIAIRRDGAATCQALDAAEFIDPANEQVMHVVMLDARFTSQQDKTYALLRALDIVRQDSYHNAFYDTTRLRPDEIALAVCRLFIRELRRLISLFDRFDAWGTFDADEYHDRNYGQRVLPEDLGIITFVADRLAEFGVSEGGTAIDVGAGPNLYPAMLVAPYCGGSLTLLEYAEANRVALETSLKEIADAGAAGSSWSKFEEVMAARNDRYAGVLESLPGRCRVEPGSIYDLPVDSYDIVTSFFVAESITTSRREFRLGLRSLSRAARIGGVIVVALMVGSIGYHAGERTRFPAVRLTPDDVREACRDADLDFDLRLVSDGEVNARPGYEGMAVVVAQRTR